MGDVISLNRYRKDRDRRGKLARAAANRLRFGRTKTERHAEQDETERKETRLDQKRLTGPSLIDTPALPAPGDRPDDKPRRS